MTQPKITIYSTHTCPFCKMEKEFLTSKGVAYENYFVDEDEAAREEMVKTTNQMGVPVTILDYGDTKHYLVGFNQPALEKALGGEKVGSAIG